MKKPYEKPVLVKREALGNIAASAKVALGSPVVKKGG
jgi:hypothetical protein